MNTVSQLAKTAQVSAETVRYYSRLGLLKAQRDPTTATSYLTKMQSNDWSLSASLSIWVLA